MSKAAAKQLANRSAPVAEALNQGGGAAQGRRLPGFSSTTSSWKDECTNWHGPRGECGRGITCKFKHTGFEMHAADGSLVQRCVTCGSKNHMNKDCTRAGGQADPEKDRHWEEYRARRAAEAPAKGKGKGKGKAEKGKSKGKGKGKDKAGAAANAAEAPTTAANASTSPTSPPQPQTQARASVVCAARQNRQVAGGALLDSGANSQVKYVKDLPDDLFHIPLTIANGESIPCAATIGEKGAPLVYIVGESDTEIMPLGWLVERLCTMSTDFSFITTPKGRHLTVHQRDHLPYLTKEDLMTLFNDLPEPQEPGRSGLATNLHVNVVCSMRLRASAVHASGEGTGLATCKTQ